MKCSCLSENVNRQTDRQTNRQSDRQTASQTDRQKDRQTDRAVKRVVKTKRSKITNISALHIMTICGSIFVFQRINLIY